ncbi:MAG: right-handed parallel beta-helix repeat-containing protein [Candidatus Eisenbacteria bacterium]|uniref:Right-handed parallel beta-helix repeat-containing protein n=1 Tax=Eiseniibacteriota bacterium TaxID=2212470 RepID=A0A948W5B9_UNCEI|nr:right-handed parallel beta-helix repeat-containing protein [Candidatus Eisenbacteria bacterium]MBU1947374.1 right-handed parallel beta-helix repeat-containing protein [Candidatus Eisenbacteria bacterium]MBU2693142.1 right-handed parallel beta-helix repeat-containing protein [Candidatus Eisenbacteria bacterium]
MKVQVVHTICVALLIFAMTFPVSATIYTISPDGLGDYATIQEAIDAAADEDTIFLTDGIFMGEGNRDIVYLGKGITVASQSGSAESCILDCESTETEPHCGCLFFAEDLSAVLSGITIRNGWGALDDEGGGIKCADGATPSINFCIFTENQNSAVFCESQSHPVFTECLFTQNQGIRGGGVYIRGANGTFNDCEFIGNTSTSGGGVYGHAADPSFTRCLFEENIAEIGGAAGFIYGGGGHFVDCTFLQNEAHQSSALDGHGMIHTSFEGCLFLGNSNESWGMISMTKSSDMRFTNCTFWDNEAPGAVLFFEEQQAYLDNTIIAFNRMGTAVTGEGTATLNCCDIYGNEGGDWVGGIAWQYGINGNISSDPIFCDPEIADLHIRADSHCAPFSPPNEECDLIGALPVGCYPPTATGSASGITTWGRIKAVYQE